MDKGKLLILFYLLFIIHLFIEIKKSCIVSYKYSRYKFTDTYIFKFDRLSFKDARANCLCATSLRR